MKNRNKLKNYLFLVLLMLTIRVSLIHAQAILSEPTIYGPIAADPPGSSQNAIYSPSSIELEANGYLEEEYFIEGVANRYTKPGKQNGEIIDAGHPYRTRLVVRRPKMGTHFNGVVLVEWINVTAGPDKDINWWLSGDHFIRNGYAYVAISAQQMGINTMKAWSPQRYKTLDTTNGGKVDKDDLSFDIFSAVGRAINRTGETSSQNQVDILDGLQAELIIATGHSQSANRLTTYINNIHSLNPVYDGFMVHGGGRKIREDLKVKVFKIMAESDMPWQVAFRQPNTENFHQWEVAGTSHVDLHFELEYAKVRNLMAGKPVEGVVPRTPDCELPAHSRVPFMDVLNAAYEHLVSWVRGHSHPPEAEPLTVLQTEPKVAFARDEYGNVLGGIRLAAHVVATARNTGMNTGTSRFCWLYGSHEPFDEETLQRLYPTHNAYVSAVKKVVQQNLTDGYILPYAAERTIREAKASNIGK